MNWQKGAVLFLAIILLGFILTVGIFIAKIQLKEVKFGSSEKASNMALFAADAGIEHALYKIFQVEGTLPNSCLATGCYISQVELTNGANYHVIVPRGDDNPVIIDSDTEYIILRAIGAFHNIERSLEVNLYKKIPAN